MASIRVRDDGSTPVSGKGREAPFKQGEFYIFDVPNDIALYWARLAPARREELAKQSRKENKDLREILDGFVHKPAHVK